MYTLYNTIYDIHYIIHVVCCTSTIKVFVLLTFDLRLPLLVFRKYFHTYFLSFH